MTEDSAKGSAGNSGLEAAGRTAPSAGANRAEAPFLPAHGGDRLALAAFSGREAADILDFSVNVRPDGPPEYLRLAMTRAMDAAAAYPSPDAAEARQAAARRYGLAPDHFVFGNGTAELFHALARVLKKRGCPLAVIPEPAFGEYERACALADLPMTHPACTLTAPEGPGGPDWILPEEAILAAPENAAVFLANPGNPAGTFLSPGRTAALMRARPDLVFVIDEAFATYAGRDSLVSLIPQLARRAAPHGQSGEASAAAEDLLPASPRCVVVRSLTKFHALAGARTGFLAEAPDLARAVQAELPPWSVNCFAMACAVAVLENGPEARRDERRARARNRADRLAMRRLLAPLALAVCRSAANYLLLRLDEPKPDLARRLLAEHGIALRDCATYRGLEDGRWYRCAVRGEEDCLRLFRALAGLVGFRKSGASEVLSESRADDRSGDRPKHGTAGAPAAACGTRGPFAGPRRHVPALMLQGTCSGAGKSVLAAAFCRIFRQDGLDVAPFKAQNMSLNSGVTMDGLEMGRAQILQAQACGLLPDARMNPVLLKPLSDRGSQVVLLGKPHSTLDARAFLKERKALRAPIVEAYKSLAAEHEVMVLEGAGSPGEVNLKEADLVNMNMAKEARAKVILAGDIDRGGVYASFLGTWLTFSQEERRLLAGYAVNRFRGDETLLAPAHDYLLRATGVPVLGVVPWLSGLRLPEEDSVTLAASLQEPASLPDPVDIAMVVLGRTSNFTDLAPLGAEPDVNLRLVRRAADWGSPDVVVLPGSRSVADDMARLAELGLDRQIRAHAAAGGWTVGLCGGMQLMGETLLDPLRVESDRECMDGLNLLPLRTTLAAAKVLTRLEHVATPFGPEAAGYEIHHGHTRLTAETEGLAFFRRPGESAAGAAAGDVLGVMRGHCLGTYLHGLFDDDAFRRAFLDAVRADLGKAPQGRVLTRWNPDLSLDRLADAVRQAFDMDRIYRLVGLR
ncbi:MAG: cobyric acid synthase [Desulfovibrionaceae bacterium]|nr:cobyric acid synthase [Desulfovibrionaceae bacterium]